MGQKSVFCDKHQVVIDDSGCPWCEIDKLREENGRLTKIYNNMVSHLGLIEKRLSEAV